MAFNPRQPRDAFGRWVLRLSATTRERESAHWLAVHRQGDVATKEIYDENIASGFTTTVNAAGKPVWANGPDRGLLVSWLLRPPFEPFITPAKDRRAEALARRRLQADLDRGSRGVTLTKLARRSSGR